MEALSMPALHGLLSAALYQAGRDARESEPQRAAGNNRGRDGDPRRAAETQPHQPGQSPPHAVPQPASSSVGPNPGSPAEQVAKADTRSPGATGSTATTTHWRSHVSVPVKSAR
jgi:hypothetical protein